MGLVRNIHVDGHKVTLTFAVTFPGCTMAPHFMAAAEAALLKIPGIKSVSTVIDTDYVWTPADMAQSPMMRGTPQAWRHRQNLS
jgi:metal-sulfur cluster biosynthetic enzyme